MVDEKLVHYVLVARSRGFPEEKIKQKLLDIGWPEYDIEEAFLLSANPDSVKASIISKYGHSKSSFLSKAHLKDVPPMFLGSLLILGIILIVSTAFTFSLLGSDISEPGTKVTGAITAP